MPTFRLTFRGTYADGDAIYDTLRKYILPAAGDIYITVRINRYKTSRCKDEV